MADISLEKRLGISFRDPSLLAFALTHRSAINERPDEDLRDNERLEFLGDAILGAVVGEYLYEVFSDASEGSLTIMRAELVRESTLAYWARRFGLGDYLVLGRGEEQRGGRERDGLLASAFEALLAAVYLDQGYEQVRALIGPLVAEALPTLSASEPTLDPKSELQHRVQARWGVLPVYQVVAVEGPEHQPTFTVEVHAGDRISGRAMGRSKQAAEQAAAQRALDAWEDLKA